MRAFIIMMCLALFGMHSALAQQRDSTYSQVQEDLERALEDFDPSDPDMGNEQLVQYLQDLAANPVNINRAGTDRLLGIPGVNLNAARAIIEYRRTHKPFERVDELTEVPGIGSVTLERMRPYITVGRGPELYKMLYSDPRYWTDGGRVEMYSRYQRTLQPREGDIRDVSEGGYAGSPVKYYQRMRYRSRHISVNITQEKDPGEARTDPIGFDYTSWHIALQDNGRLRDLVVGDYGLSFGQGLVFWNGGSFGKGRDVAGAPVRNGRGIKAYSSAQETDFYRGVAATYGDRIQATGFYSYRKRTASVIQGDTIRFPAGSGYHRTARERARRHNTRQEMYGGRLQVELPIGIVGATGYRTVFNKYIRAGTAAYNRYDFSGIYTSAFGIDYMLLLGPAQLFGEVARSQNGGTGVVAGMQSSVGSNTELSLAWRSYTKDFQSILGSGFGESSGNPQNEEGVYVGLRHSLGEKVTLSGYIDQYRFPAPRFGTHQPTSGFDWLGLIEIDFNDDLNAYVQVRSETEAEEYEEPDPMGRLIRKLGTARRSTLRAHMEYRVNSSVRLRTRLEWVQSRQAGEQTELGYLLYQDLRIVPAPAWKIDARITVFDTDSYATRVYQFENDLLYVMSNKALFEQGQRLYLLVNYEPFSFLEIWSKIGITLYEDLQTIGSGLNTIRGNRRTDLGVQVRLRF